MSHGCTRARVFSCTKFQALIRTCWRLWCGRRHAINDSQTASGPRGESFHCGPSEQSSWRHSVALPAKVTRMQRGLKAQIFGATDAVKTANWSRSMAINCRFLDRALGEINFTQSITYRQWALSKLINAFYRPNRIILQPANVQTLPQFYFLLEFVWFGAYQKALFFDVFMLHFVKWKHELLESC